MLRDAVPLGECGRALVVKLRHHGDVLLAAPVLTTLKSHAPKLEIDALLYDDTAPMFEGHPALSELHVVGRSWKALAQWNASPGKWNCSAGCARGATTCLSIS